MWETRTLTVPAGRVRDCKWEAVVSHISRKTSEMWGTRRSRYWEGSLGRRFLCPLRVGRGRLRLAGKRIEQRHQHEQRSHGSQSHHPQDGDGVLPGGGTVTAAIEQNQVADGPDVVITGLNHRQP